MVDPDLVRLLCCPETRQELREADAGLVAALNQQITAGNLKNRAGQPVQQEIEGGLIRSDGKFLYPIRQDIPIMLAGEAIPL